MRENVQLGRKRNVHDNTYTRVELDASNIYYDYV